MEEFKGDKRTKAYKEWKAKFEKEQEKNSKGLGDTVEKITKATGIEKAVKFLAGEDCGCDERKEKLNTLFRYKDVKCLEEDEYEYLREFFSKRRSVVLADTQRRLYDISNRVFGEKKQTSSCSSCVRSVVIRLEKLYKNY